MDYRSCYGDIYSVMLVNYFGPRPAAQSADAFTNGQSGMQSGQAQVAQASAEIARQPLYQQQQAQPVGETTGGETRGTDSTGVRVSSMTRELINLHEGELVFKANARSIETAQTMFQSLINIGRDEAAVTQQSYTRGG